MTAATPSALLPEDVREWLDDTYTPEGQAIWKRAYDKGDDAKRAHLLWIARGDGMGS